MSPPPDAFRAALKHLPPPRRSLAALTLLFAPAAVAQLGGSVTLVSDYRFRGVSLSRGHPVPQLTVDYNGREGGYAGLFASRVAFPSDGEGSQLTAYTGYARRWQPGLSWECGIADTHFRHATGYDYTEGFIGLSSRRLSARLYYAPSYFGELKHTLYTELNGAYPLAEHLQLSAHAGHLHALSGTLTTAPSSRNDLRIGLNLDSGDWTVQLAWIAVQQRAPASAYDSADKGTSHVLMLSTSYAF